MESTRIEDLHNSSMAPVVISGFSAATLDLAKVSVLSSQSWDMGPQLPKFLPRHPMLDEGTTDGEKKQRTGTGMVGLPPA